jgi:hypothetical protein
MTGDQKFALACLLPMVGLAMLGMAGAGMTGWAAAVGVVAVAILGLACAALGAVGSRSMDTVWSDDEDDAVRRAREMLG